MEIFPEIWPRKNFLVPPKFGARSPPMEMRKIKADQNSDRTSLGHYTDDEPWTSQMTHDKEKHSYLPPFSLAHTVALFIHIQIYIYTHTHICTYMYTRAGND